MFGTVFSVCILKAICIHCFANSSEHISPSDFPSYQPGLTIHHTLSLSYSLTYLFFLSFPPRCFPYPFIISYTQSCTLLSTYGTQVHVPVSYILLYLVVAYYSKYKCSYILLWVLLWNVYGKAIICVFV